MWPALRDWASQVPWEINGEEQLLDPEDWKDILTAAFQLEIRMAPALVGRHSLRELTAKRPRKA